jgi:spermidine synthase
VVELLEVVVNWNREFIGELNGHPLADRRVCVETGDIIQRVSRVKGAFDAILLDIDNGPNALTDPRNDRLYGDRGIGRCHQALRQQGCLAVWSAEANPAYEQRLLRRHFRVCRYQVPAAKGGKSKSCSIWVAAKGDVRLPQGGLGLGRCHSS